MPITFTLLNVETTRRYTRWRYKGVPTNSTYPTGGDTFDPTAATISAGQGHAVPDYIPNKYDVTFLDTCAGNIPEFVKGTTLKNAKVKFYSSAGTELANATYPAAMQADDFYFDVRLSKGKSQ